MLANSMENAFLRKQLQAQHIIVMRVHLHFRKKRFQSIACSGRDEKKNDLIIHEARSGGIRKIQ